MGANPARGHSEAGEPTAELTDVFRDARCWAGARFSRGHDTMAKRSSRSRANEAPGAPTEPRVPAPPQAGPSRQRRSTSAGSEAAAPQAIEPQTGGGDVVASEIENPQTITRPESERLQA